MIEWLFLPLAVFFAYLAARFVRYLWERRRHKQLAEWAYSRSMRFEVPPDPTVATEWSRLFDALPGTYRMGEALRGVVAGHEGLVTTGVLQVNSRAVSLSIFAARSAQGADRYELPPLMHRALADSGAEEVQSGPWGILVGDQFSALLVPGRLQPTDLYALEQRLEELCT